MISQTGEGETPNGWRQPAIWPIFPMYGNEETLVEEGVRPCTSLDPLKSEIF